MAFVASKGATITGSGSAQVPLFGDASGNGLGSRPLTSHVLIQASAAAVSANWDGNPNTMFVSANREVCFAVPSTVRLINVTGDSIISMGTMV